MPQDPFSSIAEPVQKDPFASIAEASPIAPPKLTVGSPSSIAPTGEAMASSGDTVQTPLNSPDPNAHMFANTTPATISRTPDSGVNVALENAENDLLRGGRTTWLGKLLRAAGAPSTGLEGGVSPAVAQQIESPILGPIHAAQGIAETGADKYGVSHPVAGPVKAVGGVLQTLSDPLSFVAPEAGALGEGSRISQAQRALIPTMSQAGEKFAPIEAAAAKVPINTAPARALTEQASEYGQAGSTVPKVLRNFMSRTNPQTGFPLPEGAESTPQVLYPEGRKFAENAGRLSAQEVMESNPQMQRLTAQFAEALKTANRDAAAKVGMADAYDDAMQSYRGASRRAELIQNAKDVAQKYILHAAATGAGLGAGYDIYHRLVK